MTAAVRLDPFYWDLRNKLIAPERNLVVSYYFLDRWAPLLGADYTAAVLQLRRLALDSPHRGSVTLTQDLLAQRLSVSLRKLQRLFAPSCFTAPDTWFLPLFVRLTPNHCTDPLTGQARQAATTYRIAIDDPLHPEDEDSLLPQLAPREAADLLHQGLEPLPVPDLAADTEDLLARLRAELPSLVTSAAQKLLRTVGPEVMARQLDWLPQRDLSWAKRGPAAAYVTYCRNNEPPPPVVEQQERVAQAALLHEADRSAAETQASLPPPSEPLLLALLEHVSSFPRRTFGPSLRLSEGKGRTYRLVCEPGIAHLLKPHLPEFHAATQQAFGSGATLQLVTQEP